jgi:uridine phosphorylase
MKTIFYKESITGKALFNPTDVIKPIENFPEVCVSTFSKQIIDKFAAFDHVEVIASLLTANGENPVYNIKYGGKEIAFYLSLVGAPACVSCFEEVIAMGAKKFVFFGSCGVLDDNLVRDNLIVPTAAIRDEGTSYHYIAPSDEITPDIELTKLLKKCLDKCGYSYTTGKIWTSDAIYRETLDMINERKKDGCIAVDMEYSALLAAAKYRNVPFIQFFYGADNLDHEEWQPRDLTDYGLSDAEKYLALALECGLEF